MNDEQTIQTGSRLFEKSMEALEELINALLNLPANNRQQFSILNRFADYAKEGGELRAIQFDAIGLEQFHKAAKEEKLTYYSIINNESSEATVLLRDCDLNNLDRVLKKCPYLPPRKLDMNDIKEIVDKNQKATEENKKENLNGKDIKNR